MLEVDGNFRLDFGFGWFNKQSIVVLLVISFVELMVLKVCFCMQHEYVTSILRSAPVRHLIVYLVIKTM
jgi:hypothetical protein